MGQENERETWIAAQKEENAMKITTDFHHWLKNSDYSAFLHKENQPAVCAYCVSLSMASDD
jgi:hypothetical protein